MGFEEDLNNVIDDDKESFFNWDKKETALLIEQGNKYAIKELSIDTNIASIKSNTDKNNYDANGNHQVNLNTALSKDVDSIDIGKMSNGGTVTVIGAATAAVTVANALEVDCRGFKNARIEVEVTSYSSGTLAPTIQGSEVSGGTYGNIYRDVAGTLTTWTLPTLAATGKYTAVITGITNFIKIPTTSGTLTYTIKVTPFN